MVALDRQRRRFHLGHFILLAYWLFLFAATHLRIPDQSRIRVHHHTDKVLHLGAFVGLAFLVAWAFQPRTTQPVRFLGLFLLLSAYAIFDEWTQMLLTYRYADAWDAAANILGVAIGLSVYYGMIASLRTFSPLSNAKRG